MHIRKRRILEYLNEQNIQGAPSNKTIRDIFLENIFVDFDELCFILNNLVELYNIPDREETPEINSLFEEEENTTSKNPSFIDEHQQRNPTFAEYSHIVSKLSNSELNEMYQKTYFLNTLQELKEDYKDLIKIFLDFRNEKELHFGQDEKNYVQKEVFLDMLKQRKEEGTVNIDLPSRSNEEIQISLEEWKNSAYIRLFLEAIATQNNEPLDFNKIFSISSHDEHSNERKLFLEAIELHKEFEEFFSNFNNIKKIFYQNWENSPQLKLLVKAFEKFNIAKEEIKNLTEIYKTDYSILKIDEYASKRRLLIDAHELSIKLTNYFAALMNSFVEWDNSVLKEFSWSNLEKHFAVLFDLENIYAVKKEKETLVQENAILKQRNIFLDNLKEDKDEFADFAKILLNDNDTYRFTPTAYKMHNLKSWERIKHVFLEEFANSMKKQFKLQSMLIKLKQGIANEAKYNDFDDQPSTSKSSSYFYPPQFRTPDSEPEKNQMLTSKMNTNDLDDQPSTSKAAKYRNNLLLPTPDSSPEIAVGQMKVLAISKPTTKEVKKPEPVDNSNANKLAMINTTHNCGNTVTVTRADIDKIPTDEHGMIKIGPNGTMIAKSDLLKINLSQSAPSFARKIISTVFDKVTLGTHSLTGKPSPAFLDCNKPKKKQLDPLKVQDIIYMVKKCTNLVEKDIRSAITTKCADEAKKINKENKPEETSKLKPEKNKD